MSHVIYSLKGRVSPRVALERTKFLILDLIVRKSKPTELESMELTYLFLRLFDEVDEVFIERYRKLICELKQVTTFLLDFNNSPEMNANMASIFLHSYDSELKLHNAYFGKRNLDPPKCLLRKRSPNSGKNYRARKRFLGVGYKDHGTMKNMAYDGSPSWQEVSAANLPGGKVLLERTRWNLMHMTYYEPFHRLWSSS